METLERFGLEPIPDEQKTTRWYEFAIIQFAFSTNSGNFLVPALAVTEGGLSFGCALFCTILGAALAFYIVSVMAMPGSKYGIPAQFAIRSLLGIKGARFISSPMRAFISMYWFSVQTIGGLLVIQAIFQKLWQISVPFLPLTLFLSLVISILAVVGFEALRKMTKYCLPLLIAGGVTVFILFLRSADPSFHFSNVWASSHATNHLSAKVFYAGLAFIQYLSGASSSADLSRYAKTTPEAHWGLFTGNILGFSFTALLAIYGSIATGGWNPYVIAYQTTDSSLVILFVFLSAMVSMVLINMFNAYSGGFSILNSFPGLDRIKSTICFCIFAIILCCFPALVEEAKKYISMLGYLVGPVLGVIVTEFVVIQRKTIHLEILLGNYNYNKKAMFVILLGIILDIFLPNKWPIGMITFAVTASTYVVVGLKKKKMNQVEHTEYIR